jgi:hypothetical protein
MILELFRVPAGVAGGVAFWIPVGLADFGAFGSGFFFVGFFGGGFLGAVGVDGKAPDLVW